MILGFRCSLGGRMGARIANWRTAVSEFPWQDPLSGDEKFLDLVVRANNAIDPTAFVVECKRAREAHWIFLRKSNADPGRDAIVNVRARIMVRLPEGGTCDDWTDLPFIPGSPEADYCVVRKGGKNSNELLEKTAAEIVRGAEALAVQESTLHWKSFRYSGNNAPPIRRIYIPVIVTTAKLYICDADYSTVDPLTGEVPIESITEVPMMRFAKSLVLLDADRTAADSVEKVADQSERSVLIIQAAAFTEILKKWNLSGRMPQSLRALLS